MKFLIGLILGMILVPLAVYVYFASGSAPVATSAAPMPFEKMLANTALHARLDKEMPKSAPPVAADEAAYAAGAQVYKEHCERRSCGRDLLESSGRHSDDGNARLRQITFHDTDVASQPAAGEFRQVAADGERQF